MQQSAIAILMKEMHDDEEGEEARAATGIAQHQHDHTRICVSEG